MKDPMSKTESSLRDRHFHPLGREFDVWYARFTIMPMTALQREVLVRTKDALWWAYKDCEESRLFLEEELAKESLAGAT